MVAEVSVLERKIERLEKRIETIESIIERLIPVDDEVLPEVGEDSEMKEYKPGEFMRLARESGLL